MKTGRYEIKSEGFSATWLGVMLGLLLAVGCASYFAALSTEPRRPSLPEIVLRMQP